VRGAANIDMGTLSIERAIIEAPGGIIETDTKTHASRRIALGEVTLAVLEAQRLLAVGRASTIGIDVDPDAYVFSREPDGHSAWTPGAVTKRFSILRRTLGFDEIRLHDLRHFAATRLIAAGVPVRTVSGRLGHANPSTTLMVYSHFVEASDQDAAKVMDRLVMKGGAVREGAVNNLKGKTRVKRAAG
jgi:integrase